LATQGEKFNDRKTCFGARMFLDRAHQRIEFARFGHQEQERKRIVSPIAAFAGEVVDGLIGKSRFRDRGANPRSPIYRGIA
jgi:hypothetical protein